jgi:aminoglycoside phosphotransferase (APT) family kinase protein
MFLVKADLETPRVPLPEMRGAADDAFGIDAALLSQAASAFGVGALQRNAHQGTMHRLYRGAGRLVRLAAFEGEPWNELMELECRLAPLLRSKGLPVPACEFRRIGGDRGAQVVDLVEGESLDTRDADEQATLRGLRTAATLLARVHAIRGQGAGPLSLERLRNNEIAGLHASWPAFVRLRLDDHLRQCEAMGAMSAEDAERAHAAFNGPLLDRAPGGALLHGDPGSHNFIFRGEFLAAMIDWEDAIVGDPVFELASMCTFHPQRRHNAILEGYGTALVRGSAQARRFWLYFLRIALAKTVHRHRFGYVDAPGRMPAAARIQLALGGFEAA